MSRGREPLVSVLTPVYNGEEYLGECIESVLRQDYANWEYTIVDNCSTDGTREIASGYAEKDPRIRVVRNKQFVDAIRNHNIAFGTMSEKSKYCKVVSADDWIYPECIAQMVRLAEAHPSIAVVGAYSINRDEIRWVGLPPERSVFRGAEVCRLHLLGGPLVMGAPSAVLYRSDVVRSEAPFFPGSALSADIAACYTTLRHHDFGFVHQILSFDRIHDDSLSTEQVRLHAFDLDRLVFLVKYGRFFLDNGEFESRFGEMLHEYYFEILAPAFVKCYPSKFWNYHRATLRDLGMKFDKIMLLEAIIHKLFDLCCNPKQTLEKIMRRRKGYRNRQRYLMQRLS
jgi:glycosyltransferase involved in cell wall biosynthesis